MPNPHFDITITQRSKGQSAVAGAAYQSGEKLFSEYDQKTKNYTGKRGILYTEIMLPSHAPPEYANRETLWNSVEAAEKQWNAQLARRFVLALPKEVPPEQYPQMVRDYCEKQFVSKGMIADFAIHDPAPPGHNVHCHVMLTLRAMDEHGKWLPKSRKVYDLDENGERIRLPSGNWKSHKEDTVDWNDQKYAEVWRQGWADTVNRYLEAAERPERLDLRSYERQGLDVIPTVHMGPAVVQMERRGIQTNIGNLNRDIKAANQMLSAIRKTIRGLLDWVGELIQAEKELLKEEAASTDLGVLLNDYLNQRKAGRSDWSWSGQQKGDLKDLKNVARAVVYPNHFIRQSKRFGNLPVGVAHCQKAQRITVHRFHLSNQFCQMLDVIGADCCIIRHRGVIWCVRDFFQRFFSLFAKHIVCTASTTTNEISGEFVTVFSMNFRKIFGNVQKHLLQHILCQIRIDHNFVSGMVDQPLVGIIYIYKLFFIALIVKNS